MVFWKNQIWIVQLFCSHPVYSCFFLVRLRELRYFYYPLTDSLVKQYDSGASKPKLHSRSTNIATNNLDGDGKGQSEICLRPACVHAGIHVSMPLKSMNRYEKYFVCQANEILQSIDLAVDPCDDFHKFSCGKWHDNNPIPPDHNRYSAFHEQKNVVGRRIKGDMSKILHPHKYKYLVFRIFRMICNFHLIKGMFSGKNRAKTNSKAINQALTYYEKCIDTSMFSPKSLLSNISQFLSNQKQSMIWGVNLFTSCWKS